jgi:hypothetical protein
MKADKRFVSLPKSFWALVRLIGQECGYAQKGKILVPPRKDVETSLSRLSLKHSGLSSSLPDRRIVWDTLTDYLTYRRDVLHNHFEPNLMTASQAKREFKQLKKELRPSCPMPLNKQKGVMKAPAFLTCIVNMLIEENARSHECDFDPRALTTIAKDGLPLRTFARRMDGAFPSVINPIAVWEVKEYYYTTTFGSRVADGVYETLLDGMEIEELSASEEISVLHYLMIDAHFTWWECGKSYLCRIVDMLHMGYVDEVLVGREVITQLPTLVRQWVKKAKQ